MNGAARCNGAHNTHTHTTTKTPVSVGGAVVEGLAFRVFPHKTRPAKTHTSESTARESAYRLPLPCLLPLHPPSLPACLLLETPVLCVCACPRAALSPPYFPSFPPPDRFLLLATTTRQRKPSQPHRPSGAFEIFSKLPTHRQPTYRILQSPYPTTTSPARPLISSRRSLISPLSFYTTLFPGYPVTSEFMSIENLKTYGKS